MIPQVTYTENQHHTKPVSQITPINPAHGDLEKPKTKIQDTTSEEIIP